MNQKSLISVLICMVGISGFSQGMLLPIIAIIFENDGISSSLNGFHLCVTLYWDSFNFSFYGSTSPQIWL